MTFITEDQKKKNIALYSVMHITQFVSALILASTIASNAQYGAGNVWWIKFLTISLLYIHDTFMSPNGMIFYAGSSACPNLISLGSIGLIFSVVIGATVLHYIFKEKDRSKALHVVFIVLGILAAFFSIAGAVTTQVGISQTCSDIKSNSRSICFGL